MVGGEQVGQVQRQREKKKYMMAAALPCHSPFGGAMQFWHEAAGLLKGPLTRQAMEKQRLLKQFPLKRKERVASATLPGLFPAGSLGGLMTPLPLHHPQASPATCQPGFLQTTAEQGPPLLFPCLMGQAT